MPITLPHNWECRDYQAPLWRYLDSGGKRAVAVWHRRAGKDQVGLHWASVASQRRVGVYWHMLPTLRQGRKVIWENIDGSGHRVMDAWPGWERPGTNGLVSHIRHDEMKVELHNGSIFYVTGSDNYDSLMGTNPVGVVFSEWALSNPKAWDYVRPILSENNGWAVFIYTPRGRNHGFKMYEMARGNPDWFAELLTIDDTDSISRDAVDEERRAGMDGELIQQEFYCSFSAPMVGAYWADQLVAAANEKRIASVPHDPSVPVDTWWDLGHSDATAIWFAQAVAGEVHLIDYYESNTEPLDHYAAVLQQRQRDRRWLYGRHIWPHDGGARTLASKGRQLSAMFTDLGYSPSVQPRQDIEVGIQRVRQVLPRCWFDERRCLNGLDALRAYRKELDEANSTEDRPHFKPKPVHDWASHGADAFRTGCMSTYAPSHRAKRGDYARSGELSGPSHWAA